MKNFTIQSLSFALLISFSITIGCSDDNNEVSQNICVVADKSYGTDVTYYTYSSDNKLIKIVYTYGSTGSETSTVTHDSKGNLSRIGNDNSYTSYIYNDKNQLVKEEFYQNQVLMNKTDYEYNDSNQLINSYYAPSGGANITTTYTYNSTVSKNPVTEKLTSSSGYVDIIESEYDDKKTWVSLIGNGLVFYQPAENNVTKETWKDENGKITRTTTYTYEYNEKGYPSKSTAVVVNSQGTKTFPSTIYNYTCK